ncbi:MAG: hypothetical protein IPK18_03930 [Sphingobacteriales bacterium]|nr:MAG: hypothetical protein IPK18_03930 [Sphingobacteriales bacterium]
MNELQYKNQYFKQTGHKTCRRRKDSSLLVKNNKGRDWYELNKSRWNFITNE